MDARSIDAMGKETAHGCAGHRRYGRREKPRMDARSTDAMEGGRNRAWMRGA